MFRILGRHINLFKRNFTMSDPSTTHFKDELSTLASTKYTLLKQHNANLAKLKQESGLWKDELTTPILFKYGTFKKAKHQEQSEDEDEGKIQAPKGTRDFHPQQMAVRRKVIDTISGVFRKHGAVEIDTPTFQLKHILTGKYGQDSKLIYDLADQSKSKHSLRYDLTVPFARYMATYTNIKKIKRFHIGKVYRRDQPVMTKGRFREFYQCDFDIAGEYGRMIPDAEVLVVMQEILEAVGVLDFKVKVNHRRILQAMVDKAGADKGLFKTICSSIDKLDKQPWAEVEHELVNQKGVSVEAAHVLGELTKFKGSPYKILEEIVGKNVLGGLGTEALEDMKLLFNYLKALGRLDKVDFDLSLARGLDYYTGVIFEIVLTDEKYEIGSISGGGRYDNLIGMFSANQIPSVGGSIGIERIFSIIEDKYKSKVKTNECEVLVCSLGKIPVDEKLKLLGELWSYGIKAETLYVEKTNFEKQVTHAFKSEIPILAMIGQTQINDQIVKIKVLYKDLEVIVPRGDLKQTLKLYIDQYNQDYLDGKVSLEVPKEKQGKEEPAEKKGKKK